MDKIKLEITSLSYSQTQSGAYALVLKESKGRRRLPIIIGGFEAQAIAIKLEGMTPSRPLSHDLFKNFAEEFHINISEVITIIGRINAHFECELCLESFPRELKTIADKARTRARDLRPVMISLGSMIKKITTGITRLSLEAIDDTATPSSAVHLAIILNR
ncbi:MAG: bifunctional nuclease family protein [Flavobacteriales bacterium]|nr:bifunctional nuclease family protein [Flavobacteriales bacterium]